MQAVHTCFVDGCERGGPIKRGLCSIHYKRWQRTGTTDPNPNFHHAPTEHGRKTTRLFDIAAWVQPRVTVDGIGCWIWKGRPDDDGYARCSMNNTFGRAHRLIYIALVGPIPPTLQLDHLCRVHLCVNPDHLDPVTQRVNILRGFSPSAMHARRSAARAAR